jgi:hypothetical protein
MINTLTIQRPAGSLCGHRASGAESAAPGSAGQVLMLAVVTGDVPTPGPDAYLAATHYQDWLRTSRWRGGREAGLPGGCHGVRPVRISPRSGAGPGD